MSNENEGPTTDGDAIGSTTSNLNSNTNKKRKQYKERSDVWNHFTKFSDENGKPRAQCKYCPSHYSCDPKTCGTSSMRQHVLRCLGNPFNASNSQSRLEINTTKDEQTGESKISLQAYKFDQKKGRKAIAEMLIIDELPFKFVENEGFRRCMRICVPALQMPSRSTVTRDCYQVFLDEKAKLKSELKKSTLRVCLTTDTWTSLQRMNYMCLTAHYIDENWKLQKKVINFCTVTSHRGNDIGRAIENCLIDWDLRNVLTVTVDNASSNDVAIEYLSSKLVKWGDNCILNAKWTHVRCMAHIINLIVQDGLKELGVSVDRVRTAIRWVRLSTARCAKFKEFASLEKIECQKSLVLDVPTRWNSTYLMLSVAVEYERAFDRFSEEDYVYTRDLEEGPGVPNSDDWGNARRLVGFLRYFYELTLRVSGTKYFTYIYKFSYLYIN